MQSLMFFMIQDIIILSFFNGKEECFMPKQLEIEFKNLLTEEEFHRLADRFRVSQNDFFRIKTIILIHLLFIKRKENGFENSRN